MNRAIRQRPATRMAAILVVLGLVAQACSGTDTATLSVNGQDLTHAEFLYGQNVDPDPDVVLQDDVVVVPNGAQAIRGISEDGLYILVNPNAEGINDLAVDKVAFITGRALGRIVHMERQGKDLLLVIMPVEITEVFLEADFQGEVDFGTDELIYYSTPEQPWTVEDVVAEAEGDEPSGFAPRTLPISFSNLAGEAPDTETFNPAPIRANWGKAPVASAKGFSKLETIDYRKNQDIGVEFTAFEKGTEVRGLLALHATTPRASWEFRISRGRLEKAQFRIHSDLTVKAGFRIVSQDGLGGNFHKQVVVPAELAIPLTAGGVPFTFRITQRFLVNTGMTAKSSYFQGYGEWKLNGNFGFGYSDGKLQVTGPTTGWLTKDPVTTFYGASMGASMAVLAHAVRFKLGLGFVLFDVGPYVDVISSAGVIRGSDLGILVCNLAYIDLAARAGLGLNINGTVTKVINAVMGLFTNKRLQSEHTLVQSPLAFLIKSGRVKPAVKLCMPQGDAPSA